MVPAISMSRGCGGGGCLTRMDFQKKFASHDAIIFIFPVLILTGARRTRDRRDASRSPLSRFEVQISNTFKTLSTLINV